MVTLGRSTINRSLPGQFTGPLAWQYNTPMKHYTLPIIIERDAEGFYVSCPPLQGCYS
jgi:hypothetical protein